MVYQGPERRQTHDCIQQEDIQELKDDMKSNRNLKSWLGSIFIVILVQIGTFLYLWGGMNEIVRKNTIQVWDVITPTMHQNTIAIERMLAKFENVKIVSVQK